MILNVNRLLHTPGASQDFHFEMDLSDLEFGGEKPWFAGCCGRQGV